MPGEWLIGRDRSLHPRPFSVRGHTVIVQEVIATTMSMWSSGGELELGMTTIQLTAGPGTMSLAKGSAPKMVKAVIP